MRSAAAERRRRAAVAQAGIDYTAARLERLEALLRDPASWQWMATHFAQVRDTKHPTTEEWAVADRLHRDALDVLRLAGEPLTPGGASCDRAAV